jgi:threonine synthase
MALVSTRDPKRTSRSYTDVLLAGLAPDGGLYVPSKYPTFLHAELQKLKNESYEDIAFAVKQKLVADAIHDADMRQMIADAYSAPIFERERGQVTPVSDIGNSMWLENLSLGPTASFKDMAMQLLAREMSHELKKRDEKLVILGATSGDTGSAAEAAFKGLPNIILFMLSPEVGMSDFQKAQMGSLSGGNIFNISIRGRFDDCQDLVKEVKHEREFAFLGAVNSINWGRISSQVPYYFSGYFQVAQTIGDPVDVVVPSGNFGNILSGYIAKRMGLPVRRLIVATNENDVLHKLFTTGVYENTPAQITSSPSMDISKASNYERLAFDVLGHDAEKTSAYMREFNEKGRVSLADYGARVTSFKEFGFESGSSTHADRLATIKRVYDENKIIIDPHTADGVFVGASLRGDVPVLCISTALPVKFEHTIREALGFVPPRPGRFIERGTRAHDFAVIGASTEELKTFIRARI